MSDTNESYEANRPTLRWRKRPVEIEAFQLTQFSRQDNRYWPEWLNHAWNLDRHAPGAVSPLVEGTGDGELQISTLEGVMTVSFGDWIIRGVSGELYPCKPDIFEKTYEAVEYEPAY